LERDLDAGRRVETACAERAAASHAAAEPTEQAFEEVAVVAGVPAAAAGTSAGAGEVEAPVRRRPKFLARLALSERVVGCALFGVAQHLVSLADLLEARLGVGLFADVGMVL